MTDVKRLLAEATPLPWRKGVVTGYGIYGNHRDEAALATVRHWSATREPMDARAAADAALIVHAVNSLPAYEEAVEALERFVTFHGGHVLPNELARTMGMARAALARLRGDA